MPMTRAALAPFLLALLAACGGAPDDGEIDTMLASDAFATRMPAQPAAAPEPAPTPAQPEPELAPAPAAQPEPEPAIEPEDGNQSESAQPEPTPEPEVAPTPDPEPQPDPEPTAPDPVTWINSTEGGPCLVPQVAGGGCVAGLYCSASLVCEPLVELNWTCWFDAQCESGLCRPHNPGLAGMGTCDAFSPIVLRLRPCEWRGDSPETAVCD